MAAERDQGASPARAWLLLGLLSLVAFQTNAATFNSLGVLLPAMVRDLGWNWTEAGLGFTVLGGACGASALLPAILIRRFGVRATLLAGTAVMSCGFFCLSRAVGVWSYLAGAGICGVGYQMTALIPGTHVLAALFQRRGVPFGIYFTFAALGGVAGPWMVWAVGQTLPGGWRTYWLVAMGGSAVLGLLCAGAVGGRQWLAAMGARTDLALGQEAARSGRGRIWRTPVDWSVSDAVRTPQFLILLVAYFGHLLVGATVASLSVAHLTQRGVAMSVAVGLLSFEALVQTGGRAVATLVGDFIDPRWLLLLALGCLDVGSAALSVAQSYLSMIAFAVGSGLGFGLTALAVSMLLLNYFGRSHNLELFARTCLVGAFSALGPTLGGHLRDITGGFGSTFQICSGLITLVFVAVAFMQPPKLRSVPPTEPVAAKPLRNPA